MAVLLMGWVVAGAAQEGGGIAFENVSRGAGVIFEGQSYGIAWGDVNGDGWPDIWSSNHWGNKFSLYVNQRNGSFTDVGASVSPSSSVDAHGVAWADLDNDGDQDLLQLIGAGRGRGSGSNLLYLNSQGVLAPVAGAMGLDYPLGRGRTPAWFDWDNDGRLDVIIMNAARAEAPTAIFRQTTTGFENITEQLGFAASGGADFPVVFRLKWGTPLLVGFWGSRGPVATVTANARNWNEDLPQVQFPRLFSIKDAVVEDINNDGQYDIVMARGSVDSELYQPDPRTLSMYLQTERRPVKASWYSDGDLNIQVFPRGRDWWTGEDIVIGDGIASSGGTDLRLRANDETAVGPSNRLGGRGKTLRIWRERGGHRWSVELIPGQSAELVSLTVTSSRPISDTVAPGVFFGGSLGELLRKAKRIYRGRAPVAVLVNKGGSFRVEDLPWDGDWREECFSVGAGDFDNDGDVDIYAVCSFQTRNRQNILYENLGGLAFRRVEGAAGAPGAHNGGGDRVAVADFDRDGFLDMFVTNGRGMRPFNFGSHELFRNKGNGNHWLQIDLRGRQSNSDGIGAEVAIWTDGTRQIRMQNGGIHNGSQNDQRIHFGLGKRKRVEKVRVRWPSGIEQDVCRVDADRIIIITESRETCHSANVESQK